MELADLIDGLSRPRALPPPGCACDRVDVIQTHASVLFLAGERVFKLKKPADLGFLDFSTLEKRRRACEDEVRLNRRLAPSVYLGVRPVVIDEGAVRLGDAAEQGRAIDWVVEMVRLPAPRMLDAMLARDETPDLGALVDLIADFHDGARSDSDVARYGEPDGVLARVMENLDELTHAASGRAPEVVSLASRVRTFTDGYLERHAALIAVRPSKGRIREGHGDLHAGNICFADSGLVVYDCIEFAEAFRCLDVAAEIAFLAMDLDARGHPELADEVTGRYATRTADGGVRALAPLYRAHYACVRAKVALARSGDGAPRNSDLDEAHAYAALGAGWALPPCVVITCGLPGTGKSFAGRAVATALRARMLRSDVLRREVACPDAPRRFDDALNEGAYDPGVTDRTYAAMLERGRAEIESGRSVVLDATFPSRGRRDAAIAMARDLGAPCLVLHTTASEATVRDRLGRRPTEPGNVSDAGWRVYEVARGRFEAPGGAGVMEVGEGTGPGLIAARAVGRLIRSSEDPAVGGGTR